MQIKKGLVKYKERNDILCTYGVTDDGKTYYFLEGNVIPNGNIVATTVLVEAIDPLANATSIGIIDPNGNVIVPFENRSIKVITDNLLLLEKSVPVTDSVIEANELRGEPQAASKLVTTPAIIKDNLYSKMGTSGKFVFNDQFSEATICDVNGNNIIDNKLYSFIGLTNDKIYLCQNTAESKIDEYDLTNQKFNPYVEVKDDSIDIANSTVTLDDINKAVEEQENQLNGGDITSKDFENTNNIVSNDANTQDVVSDVAVEKKLDVVPSEIVNANNNIDKNMEVPVNEETPTNEIVTEPLNEETPTNEIVTEPVNEETPTNEIVTEPEKNVVPESEDVEESTKEVVEENVVADTEISDDVTIPTQPIDEQNSEIDLENPEKTLVTDRVAEDTNNKTDIFSTNEDSIKPETLNKGKHENESTVDLFEQSNSEDISREEVFDSIRGNEESNTEKIPYEEPNYEVSQEIDSSIFNDDFSQDIFADSKIKVESITQQIPENKNYGRRYDGLHSTNGTLVQELVSTVPELVKKTQYQHETINLLNKKIDKATDLITQLKSYVKEQNSKISNLSTTAKKYKVVANKLNEKVIEKDRTIARLLDEIDDLKSKVVNQRELAKVVSDVKMAIGDSTQFDMDDEQSYYKRVA